MATREEKQQILQTEFSVIQQNQNGNVTKEAYYNFLDNKINREYDRTILEQLIEQMRTNYDSTIPLSEIIRVTLDAEEVLKQKIEMAKKTVENYMSQKREALQKLEQLKNEEQYNSNNIALDSAFFINIKEGQFNLQDLVVQAPYFLIQCGEIKQETTAAQMPTPVWNQSLQFHVETGKEEVKIHLLDKASNSNQVLGIATIPLTRIKDQYNHEEQIELFDSPNQFKKYVGKIHVLMQWLHSKLLYHQNFIEKLDDCIKTQEEDIMDFEKDLSSIYEPFKALTKAMSFGNASNVQNRQILQQPFSMQQSQQAFKQNYLSQEQQPAQVWSDKKLMLQDVNILKPQQEQPLQLQNPNDVDHGTNQYFEVFYYSKYIMYIYGVFILLTFFYRTLNVDILLWSLMYLIYTENVFSKESLILILEGILGTFVLDLFWIICYSGNWWSQENYTDIDNDLESGIKKYTILISFIIFLFKIALGGIYGYLYMDGSKLLALQSKLKSTQNLEGLLLKSSDLQQPSPLHQINPQSQSQDQPFRNLQLQNK